jgi:hypothetical protein
MEAVGDRAEYGKRLMEFLFGNLIELAGITGCLSASRMPCAESFMVCETDKE